MHHCPSCTFTTHSPHITHSPHQPPHITCSQCGHTIAAQVPTSSTPPPLDPASPTASTTTEADLDDSAFQLLSEAFGKVDLDYHAPLTFASAHYVQPTYANFNKVPEPTIVAPPVQTAPAAPPKYESNGLVSEEEIRYAREWARSIGMDDWEVEQQLHAEIRAREAAQLRERDNELQQKRMGPQAQAPPGIGVGDGCGVINVNDGRDSRFYENFYKMSDETMDDEEMPCAAFQRDDYRCRQWV